MSQIRFDMRCICGKELEIEEIHPRLERIRIVPCEDCLERAKEEGLEEGHEAGYEEGLNEST